MIPIFLSALVISTIGTAVAAASECGKYLDISEERYSGTVKSINRQNGNGVVATASRDYPLALEDLKSAGIDEKALAAGAKVSFQVQFDKICRAYKAINLRPE